MAKWQTQLEGSQAVAKFQACRPDKIPLSELQAITTSVLARPRLSLTRQALQPGHAKCDEFFSIELESYCHELWHWEVATLACLHVLSLDRARILVKKMLLFLQDQTSDEHFTFRAQAYLQCLFLAHDANSFAFKKPESKAAGRLLLVLTDPNDWSKVPDVWKLLAIVGTEKVEELIPLSLVKRVLEREQYGRQISHELHLLLQDWKLDSAYRMVDGMRDALCFTRTQNLLGDIFPDYLMWQAWTPDVVRIQEWENNLSLTQRMQLRRIIELEGPDTTGKQGATLRESCPGTFRDISIPPNTTHREILDQIVSHLHLAVRIGPNAISLIIQLYLPPHHDSNPPPPPLLTQSSTSQAIAALDLNNDASIGILCKLLQTFQSPTTSSNFEILSHLTTSLPLLQAHPSLQTSFGNHLNLAAKTPFILQTAQEDFQTHLHTTTAANNNNNNNSNNKHKTHLRYGLSILAFARALRDSPWLHRSWRREFVSIIKEFPTPNQIQATFEALEDVERGSVIEQGYMNALSHRVGGLCLDRSKHPYLPLPSPDPLWYVPLTSLDLRNLRQALKKFPEIPPVLALQCLKQAVGDESADGKFIGDLYECMREPCDAGCVQLSNLLGQRLAYGRSVAEPWRALLLFYVDGREGLLVQRAAQLKTVSRLAWAGNLHRVLGGRLVDHTTGNMYTRDRLEEVMRGPQSGVDRMASTRTNFSVPGESMESGYGDITREEECQ